MAAIRKRVYVGGLADKISSDEVKELFMPYVDHYFDFQLALGHKNKSRGFGFLTIDITEANWERCLGNLNGLEKNGCTLKVQASELPKSKVQSSEPTQPQSSETIDKKPVGEVVNYDEIKAPQKDKDKRQKITFDDEGEIDQVDELPSNKLDVNRAKKEQNEDSLDKDDDSKFMSGSNAIGLGLTANEKRLEALRRKDEEFKQQANILQNAQAKKSRMVFGDDGELVEAPVIVEEKKTKQRVRNQEQNAAVAERINNEEVENNEPDNNVVLTDTLQNIFSDKTRAFGGFSFFDPPSEDEEAEKETEVEKPVSSALIPGGDSVVVGASFDSVRSHDKYFFFHFNTPKFMAERFKGEKLFCRTKTNEEYIQSLGESRSRILSEAKGRHKRVIRQKLANKHKIRKTE
ncbi:hypothetical protein CONCODRAFT_79510 [Conidiobolus coronatus NRRL 28638]|uniref:RRM domain-containing protein n=1 Tax=Conidiobolus coronatus (strain ATCC 28846 / CBS 209.66 / NRRL 28638) TaxID=796925 RepID=A0A137P2C7_CONC2|nr:hypothetical protein CONCODRAFT_79510 [Conidiobolus coronatus NRRL 28638]|eukprot:KXN69049.1 hypothetical protein CONCODRAFT_79510 [Conidiobolus coronatus NRRL 28638]